MALKRKAEDSAEMDQDGFDEKDKKRKDFQPSRAVYLGNIHPATTTYFDICTLANEFGGIEMVKIMPHKRCAFLNFYEEGPARAFVEAAQENPPKIGEQVLRVSYAKTSDLSEDIKKQVEEQNATRNLFVGNVGDMANEDMLAHLFQRFGPFENIIILRPKGIAFVNLTSVRNAIAAKEALDGADLAGKKIKVNFAKEKIGVKPGAVRRPMRPFGLGMEPRLPPPAFFAPLGPPAFFPGPAPEFNSFAPTGLRGIYLGNVQQDVTPHELCKLANRFGALESVKIMREKQCAFLNFIDPAAAQAFWMNAQHQPIIIGANTLKCNWAKSGPLHVEVLNAIQAGATRNLFIGNVEEHIDEEMLRDQLREFGDLDSILDSIVIIRPKKIAFVNLTSIHTALNVKDKLQGRQIGDPPVQLKVNFAKEVAGRGRPAPRLPAAPGPAAPALKYVPGAMRPDRRTP